MAPFSSVWALSSCPTWFSLSPPATQQGSVAHICFSSLPALQPVHKEATQTQAKNIFSQTRIIVQLTNPYPKLTICFYFTNSPQTSNFKSLSWPGPLALSLEFAYRWNMNLLDTLNLFSLKEVRPARTLGVRWPQASSVLGSRLSPGFSFFPHLNKTLRW